MFLSGSISTINNFRPIYILSLFSKSLEKIVKFQFQTFLKVHSIIMANQYGLSKDYQNTSNATFDVTISSLVMVYVQ